jgi:hypothetical protein
MATLTLTIEGSTIGSATVTTTLDPTNSDRLVAFLMAMHGTDEEGNARDLEGVIRSYWQGIVAGTAANVERHEKAVAAQAAQDAVTPLAVTVS